MTIENFKNQVILGNCLKMMRQMPDNSVDCLITDPPAGISFMGKKWDGDAGGMIQWVNWLSEILHEAMRVMKPGACGAIWSLPRTCGWTQLAIELAGFRIWESVAVVTGQGFPKAQSLDDVLPGWKSCGLKPAHETWFLVQRPISESCIARNVLKWGVGGICIDKCRIPISKEDAESVLKKHESFKNTPTTFSEGWKRPHHDDVDRRKAYEDRAIQATVESGRFPANLILQCSPDCTTEKHAEHCPVEIMGRQSGVSAARANRISDGRKHANNKIYGDGKGWGEHNPQNSHTDTGTAARFFLNLPHDPDTFIYLPKASKSDRTCNGAVANTHPTVKPRNLMAYFSKLLCPPNGIILDCFAGSGTTALAAIQEGFNYILIEQYPEYIEIIHKRIAATKAKVEQPIASPQTGNALQTQLPLFLLTQSE